MADAALTRYGFTWGALKVERACDLPDDRVLLVVSTAHRSFDIYASKTGRSLRVFEPGVGELKVVPDQQPRPRETSSSDSEAS